MADLSLNAAPVANYTPPQAPQATNPLGMASTIMQMQQLQNQNQLFQQEFAAKQGIGQIMSTAPSIDAGLEMIQKSPFAAFAGPAAATARAAELAKAQTAQTQQLINTGLMEQHQKGIAYAMNGLLPAMADPAKMLDSQAQTVLKTFPPEMRSVLQERIKDLKAGIEVGVTKDMTPEQALEKRRANLAGALSPHIKADDLYGPTVNQDVGNATEVYRLPPAWGDQNQPRKLLYSIPKGVGPRTDEGGMLVPGITSERAQQPGTAGAQSALPLFAQGAGSAGSAGPLGLPANTPPGAQAPVAAARPEPRAVYPKLSDYSLLPEGGVTPGMLGQSYSTMAYHAPSNTMISTPATAAERSQEAKLSDQFTGDGQQRYTAAQNALKQMPVLEQDINNAIKAGFAPGAGAPLKVEVAKAGQAILDLINPNRDKSKDLDTSSAESAMKSFTKLGIDAAKAQLNQPQIAAESLFKGLEGNPSFTNTPLGLKLILSGMKSDLQREVDRRNYQVAWKQDPRNHGQLNGADEEFDRRFPVNSYAQKVLDEHQMILDKGQLKFQTLDSVRKAVQDGLLTPDQAADIASKQGFKAPGR